MSKPKIIRAVLVSQRGTSARITVPKEATSILKVEAGDTVGYYELDGNVVLKKIE